MDNIIKEFNKRYYKHINDINDFNAYEDIPFYILNLVNGYKIRKKAIDNLLNKYNIITLLKVKNYDELGIVEFVANNQYYIDDNYFIKSGD